MATLNIKGLESKIHEQLSLAFEIMCEAIREIILRYDFSMLG